ncbi:hypothetical protein RHMOL_Rhmol11G0022800 [Rhododendron molle]|uniref:Uncharacterized protein n=1 Tax=Rhododendron molle TaxID=49168 RepID=A0ACC0LPD6_RHOML|nr:hypothetical protein RHMOL_Rhmol11G0022800 [Rhododendron molle]
MRSQFLAPLQLLEAIWEFDWGASALATLYGNLGACSRDKSFILGVHYRVLEAYPSSLSIFLIVISSGIESCFVNSSFSSGPLSIFFSLLRTLDMKMRTAFLAMSDGWRGNRSRDHLF